MDDIFNNLDATIKELEQRWAKIEKLGNKLKTQLHADRAINQRDLCELLLLLVEYMRPINSYKNYDSKKFAKNFSNILTSFTKSKK